MSKALRCDRCKKCFVPEEETGVMMMFRNPSVYDAEEKKNNIASNFREDFRPDAFLDLCPLCTTKFTFFMRGFDPVFAEITDPLVEKDGV